MISSQYRVILDPTTDEAASDSFGISDNMAKITISCFDLQGSETATVQAYDPISGTYKNLTQPMTSSANLYILDILGSFRVMKTATAAPVGISICGAFLPMGTGGAL